jgi:hypothetical protein
MNVRESRPKLIEDGRLLILSYYFPPMAVGPAFVVDALLAQLNPEGVTVFTGDPDLYSHSPHRDASWANGMRTRRFDVPAWWPLEDRDVYLAGRRIPLRLRAIGNVLVGLRVACAAAAELRSGSRALLVVYPKQHFLLGAWVAATITRKPLLVYFMDVYVEGLTRTRRIASLIERLLARRAKVLFAMSDRHEQHLRQLVARECSRARVIQLPHPYASESTLSTTTLTGRPSIVFTGAIYDAQADAIRRLAEALDSPLLADLDPQLHLFSADPPDWIAQWGIEAGGRVHLARRSRDEARAAQRAADILFLPIAFDAKPHVQRTASPSKMPEYLAAGRPILVHAPPESSVAEYARLHGFAEVVDEPNVEALAAAVRRLAGDEPRRRELTERAAETLPRHEAATVAGILRRAVSEAI